MKRVRAALFLIVVSLGPAPLLAQSPSFNYLQTPVDVTPAVAGSWQDVDASAYIPVGATGVIVQFRNPSGIDWDYGIRMNGSTDAWQLTVQSKSQQQGFLMTGVDANRIFEVYTENTGARTHLVGYTMQGVTFFLNRIDKSLAATGAWTNVNISADTGAATAIGAIFTVSNLDGSSQAFGLRKNGSADSRVTDIRADTASVGLIGVDGAEIAQMQIGSTLVDLYLVGYVTSGAVFFTNAVNKSTATTGSYVDVDITGDIGTNDANGAILEITPSDNTRRLTALRPKGATYDFYLEHSHGFAGVGIDWNDVFQQKIELATMDVYLIGYSLGNVNYRSIGAAANYTAGTVAATNGSNVVTGTGTAWRTANRGRGDRINIDATDYTVLNVASETSLILTTPFTGITGGLKAYTIARKFSTFAAWEDCVDGGAGTCAPFPNVTASLVADNRSEVGIAYKDSVFTPAAQVLFVGATTDTSHTILLTADPGNRHNGVPGAGVVIDGVNANRGFRIEDNNYTVEWLEFIRVRGVNDIASVLIRSAAASQTGVFLQNLLIHDFFDGANDIKGIGVQGNGGKVATIRNTMIWDGDIKGIEGDAVNDTLTIENCTVDGMTNYGIDAFHSQFIIRNTIATRNPSGDFVRLQADGSLTGSNNTSSDVTAAGPPAVFANPQTSVAASALYVDEVGPVFDLHLEAGANVAVSTGLNLASSFAFDIDGELRPAGPWDRGADERDATTTAVELQSFQARPADAAVDLEWETASELKNLGFHVYRSSSGEGPFERITSSLIPGLGSSPTGASYTYRDSGLQNGQTYYYELEDVETSGRTRMHGPVAATPAGGAGPAVGPDDSGGSASPGDSRITYGHPEAASFRTLERGERHVLLELVTPGFHAVPEGDGTVRLEVPGFESGSVTGAPSVPVKRTYVEALAGRQVHLTTVRSRDEVRFDGLRVAAAASPEIVVTDEGTMRPGRAKRRGLVRPGFFPRSWAQVLEVVFQGETKKVRLELSPLRYDAARGTTLLARRLLVRLDFVGVDKAEKGLGGSRGRRPRPTPVVRADGRVAELITREAGLYRVRYEDVFRSPRGVLSASLRLSYQGQGVGYHLEPDKAVFGPGSALYFLSEGQRSNPWGDAVYTLETGKPALRMPTVSGSPSGPAATEYLDLAEREENRFYQAGLLDAPDLWLWDLLVSPVARSYPVTVSQLSSSSTSARLTVWLQGASDFEANPDHHVRVLVNGLEVGEASWDAKTEQVIDAEVLPGILKEGANTVSLENVGDTAATYSMVFLNRFSLRYPRTLVAENDRIQGRFDQSGSADVLGLTGPAFVLETQGEPKWLRAPLPTETGVSFRAEGGRTYLAVSERALKTPTIRRAVASGLRSASNRADWVLVGPRELLATARPLVDLRRSQGLRVKTVCVEEIDQEFGHGEHRPQAVKEFLEYAYHAWQRPSFRYVVLLGDGSYDPKDYLKTGVKDWIPPYMVKTSYLWTASDPAYGAVNGEDLIADVAVGRLSAGTVEEARILVEKIVAFETAGRTLAGKAVLIADNTDLGGAFEGEADEIAATILGQREVEKIYLRELGDGTRATIAAAFDGGAGLVSYAGHGGTAVWASENVFNNLDVATLNPQGKQPLLMTMNCLNGFFHFPVLDSLAEALVKAAGKGAVAAFSPSGLSVNDAAHLYHKAVLEEIESGRHARLGDAILAAQAAYADSGAMPELMSIYQLLGDPALTIR